MRNALILITVLIASSSVAASGPFNGFGIGELSCGKYLNEVSTNPQAANSYSWWVAGFVTGTNFEKGRTISTDNLAHDAWLKQYCEKNPLDAFMNAAVKLNEGARQEAITVRSNIDVEAAAGLRRAVF